MITNSIPTSTRHDAVDVGMSDGEKTELAIIMLIYCVGVVGNIVVIFMTIFLNEFKKVTHWYVLQLALADIAFLQTLIFHMYELINREAFRSISICRTRQSLLYLNYYASILFLTVMAVDRYLAVCHPLSTKIQRLRSRRNSVILTTFVWILAIGFTLPVILYSKYSATSCECLIHFPSSSEDWSLDDDATACGEIIIAPEESSQYGSGLGDEFVTDDTPVVFGNGFDEMGSSSGNGTESHFTNPDHFDMMGNNSEDGIATSFMGSDESNSIAFGGPFPNLDDSMLDKVNLSAVFNDTLSGLDDTLAVECSYDGESAGWIAYIYLNAIVLFLIPLIAISVSYYKIIGKLVETGFGGSRASAAESKNGTKRRCFDFLCPRMASTSSKASTGKSYREKRRVSVMCAALVLLFACCWLLFHSVHLAKIVGISAQESYCVTLTKVANFLAFANSALNPYLYSFLGTCKKRMRQVRSHKRMQIFLSATGITRFTGRSGGSVNNSSETSRAKKANSVFAEESSTNAKSEGIALQTFRGEKNGQ